MTALDVIVGTVLLVSAVCGCAAFLGWIAQAKCWQIHNRTSLNRCFEWFGL